MRERHAGEPTGTAMRQRSCLLYLASGPTAIAVMAAAAEGLSAAYRYVRNGTLKGLSVAAPELGWVATPNLILEERVLRDRAGNPYTRDYRTDRLGSRSWGTNAGAKRVFIVGDSYTQSADVSNERTWSAIFSEITGYDVYACGVGAYGTLQEMLAYARLAERVRPDFLTVQFCTNDFVKNAFGIESESVPLSQTIRPYLVGGDIFYRNDHLFRIYRFLIHASIAFNYIEKPFRQSDTSCMADISRKDSGRIWGWRRPSPTGYSPDSEAGCRRPSTYAIARARRKSRRPIVRLRGSHSRTGAAFCRTRPAGWLRPSDGTSPCGPPTACI